MHPTLNRPLTKRLFASCVFWRVKQHANTNRKFKIRKNPMSNPDSTASTLLTVDEIAERLKVCRPLRRRNFASLEIGKSFALQGDAYVIDIPGSEMKNHAPYRSALNSCLTPYIQKYLECYRPFLLGNDTSTNLWISWGGKPLLDGTLYGVIMARTKAAFGRGLSPHLFRDCAITSLGHESPEHVWLGMYLLNHKDSRTTEKHYDQALSGNAVREYQNSLMAQRKKITKKQRDASMILRPKNAAS